MPAEVVPFIAPVRPPRRRRWRYIVCYNTQEAARQAAHRARAVQLLEGELAALAHAGSAHPRRACELLTSLRFRQLDRVKVAALPTPHGRLVQTSELAPETRNLLNRLQIPPPPTILETSWAPPRAQYKRPSRVFT